MTDSGFADKQCGCVVAQSQTGGMFDGECAIRADFTGLDLQVAAQRVRQRIGAGKGAHRRAADPRHGPAHRLAGEHLVKIDDTKDIGERHTQSAAHFGSDRFGNPAMDLLSRMQGGQERRAALRRQLGKERAQENEFAIGHLRHDDIFPLRSRREQAPVRLGCTTDGKDNLTRLASSARADRPWSWRNIPTYSRRGIRRSPARRG